MMVNCGSPSPSAPIGMIGPNGDRAIVRSITDFVRIISAMNMAIEFISPIATMISTTKFATIADIPAPTPIPSPPATVGMLMSIGGSAMVAIRPKAPLIPIAAAKPPVKPLLLAVSAGNSTVRWAIANGN